MNELNTRHGVQVSPSNGRQVAVLLLLLAIVAAVATAGSLVTFPNVDGWYAEVNKVDWTPPNAVFGPAWTVLYVLIAIAGWLVWRRGFIGHGEPNLAAGALTLYVVQLLLNAAWSPLFFGGYPAIGELGWWLAMIVILLLIVTVIALIGSVQRWSKLAGVLLLPYLLWLIFASTLNAGIIALN